MKNINYRVSVLTSIYNSIDFLEDFFLDVKRQSMFCESEILILDANETDEDYQVVKKFLHFDNIKYIKLKPKCSVYEAWNIGIKMSTSPILTNWNTDDRRSYNSLDTQVSFLENNSDVDLCYGMLKTSKTPNEQFEYCGSDKIWPCLEGTLENQIKHNSPHCLPVWRKSVHDRFGLFDESYFSASDYDMWFKILKGGGKLKMIEEVLGLYYENPNSISRNVLNLEKAIKEVSKIRKIYSE